MCWVKDNMDWVDENPEFYHPDDGGDFRLVNTDEPYCEAWSGPEDDWSSDEFETEE